MKACVPIAALIGAIFVAAALAHAGETEVSVMKGKVIAQSNKGSVEVEAGQRGIMQEGRAPVAIADNVFVKNLIEMANWVQAERMSGKEPFEGSTIHIARVDDEKTVACFDLAEMPPRDDLSSDTCVIDNTNTLLSKNWSFYDMEGKSLTFDVKKWTENRASVFIHFPKAIRPGEKFKFIYTNETAVDPFLLSREGSMWKTQIANPNRNWLNYFCFVLPSSGVFVKATQPPFCSGEMGGRTYVTFRGHTGPNGENGQCAVYFLWPDHDGTSLKDLSVRTVE